MCLRLGLEIRSASIRFSDSRSPEGSEMGGLVRHEKLYSQTRMCSFVRDIFNISATSEIRWWTVRVTFIQACANFCPVFGTGGVSWE